MSRYIPASALVLFALLAAPISSARAQEDTVAPPDVPMEETMVVVQADELEWAPVEVPGFDPGMEIAVLNGDPSQAGPYTLRLRFPSGYAFPPHWHPMTENLTVISGSFFLAMGETADPEALQAYEPGDYLVAPARQPHYGQVEGETVIQLHGVGPFEINVVQ